MGEQVAAGIKLKRVGVTWSADNVLSGTRKTDGGVAQLGEHLPCKQGVKSSNLSVSIKDN